MTTVTTTATAADTTVASTSAFTTTNLTSTATATPSNKPTGPGSGSDALLQLRSSNAAIQVWIGAYVLHTYNCFFHSLISSAALHCGNNYYLSRVLAPTHALLHVCTLGFKVYHPRGTHSAHSTSISMFYSNSSDLAATSR